MYCARCGQLKVQDKIVSYDEYTGKPVYNYRCSACCNHTYNRKGFWQNVKCVKCNDLLDDGYSCI